MKTMAAMAILALACAPASAQDSTKSEVEGKLNNIKVTLDFANAPLDQVVDYLREISGLNIFVDSKARVPDALVTIRDLAGDGDHYAATVIAESFRGKSRVAQHQIVYEALKGEMGGKLHALALQTGTPER